MLRITDSDGIELTIDGEVIASLDASSAITLTAHDLVRWENVARRQWYEKTGGYWSAMLAEIERYYGSESDVKQWEERREAAIDK